MATIPLYRTTQLLQDQTICRIQAEALLRNFVALKAGIPQKAEIQVEILETVQAAETDILKDLTIQNRKKKDGPRCK